MNTVADLKYIHYCIVVKWILLSLKCRHLIEEAIRSKVYSLIWPQEQMISLMWISTLTAPKQFEAQGTFTPNAVRLHWVANPAYDQAKHCLLICLVLTIALHSKKNLPCAVIFQCYVPRSVNQHCADPTGPQISRCTATQQLVWTHL